jgi:tripartite ATP-independent transporter DctM subunit
MAIVYGATAGISIAGLFLGGAIPGVLIGLSQLLISYRYAVRIDLKTTGRQSVRRIVQATRESILTLFIPIILIGGIVGGAFTPTEAGMVASVYALLTAMVVYRTLSFSHLPRIFWKTGRKFAVIMFTVGLASPFAWMISYLGLPDMVGEIAARIGESPLIIFAFVVILFVIVGDFLDATPSIIIFYPIIKVLTEVGGIHPIHIGVVVIMTLAFGFITPPYGLTLLLASAIAGISFTSAMRALLIFYVAFLVIITLTVLFPEIALFLPRLMLPSFR